MDAKLKRLLFILNILYCISSGCENIENDCYTDIYCSNGEFHWASFFRTLYSNDHYCSYINNWHGKAVKPLRVKIENENFIVTFLRATDTDNDSNNQRIAIVSLEITNTLMANTPALSDFVNLKTLNFSNNYLNVAKLFNEFELISLDNVDLSHNIIDHIQVDNDQHVYSNMRNLNLSNNIIKEIPGGTFEPFKLMERLDLSYNNLVSIDHSTFEGLRNLKYLHLSYNNISELNVSLYRFSHLEELYLDNNNIYSLSSQDFDALRNLRTLNLSFNKISSIHKDTFSSTESLRILKIQHNLLNHIHIDTFLSTNELYDIDLSHNLIQSLTKDLFINKHITSFSIIGNKLDGAISKGTFEGLQPISELDISFQRVNALEDFAFFGLAKLTTLLLNNNNIRNMSEHSFDSLISLKQLDLSHNFIVNIGFNKGDLLSIQIFSLRKNFIQQILPEDLQGLNRLRSLDLANNNITKLNSNSFKTLENIESLQLLANPINGVLLNNTFNGLHLVPVLDLSCSLIISIQNGTFTSMVQLQELNISRGSITKLEYNAFVNTGNIKSLDLSFNNLTEFLVNGNYLNELTSLYLNNNAIFQISNYFFKHMVMLSKIIISYNSIINMSSECFADQTNLRYLDLSFNHDLTLQTSAIKNCQTLETLLLSGVKSELDFAPIGSVPIKKLELSFLSISNVSLLHLNSFRQLTNLVINNNNIVKIEFSTLRNISNLKWLDLSFNKISYIQPGSFKDNIFINYLNLSHNSLSSLSFGIFRGLASLNVLDVSYNSIHDLKRERFYDTQNLKTLIVDYNSISDVGNDFFDINLDILSIGHNPLPCENVISLKQLSRFDVSAINIDESNGDNVDGIACNINNNIPEQRVHISKLSTTMNEKILVDIRDILLNLSGSRESKMSSAYYQQTDLLKDILDHLDKYGVNQTREIKNIHLEISQLRNVRTDVGDDVQRTNSFLERILKVLLGFGSLQNRFIGDVVSNRPFDKNNLTNLQNNTSVGGHSKVDVIVSDINRIKDELLYIENAISDINRKISLEKILYSKSTLNKSEHINEVDNSTGKTLIFLEVCVSLILIMLICFFLYKFYEAKIFSQTRSLSTRDITDVMDNSNL